MALEEMCILIVSTPCIQWGTDEHCNVHLYQLYAWISLARLVHMYEAALVAQSQNKEVKRKSQKSFKEIERRKNDIKTFHSVLYKAGCREYVSCHLLQSFLPSGRILSQICQSALELAAPVKQQSNKQFWETEVRDCLSCAQNLNYFTILLN